MFDEEILSRRPNQERHRPPLIHRQWWFAQRFSSLQLPLPRLRDLTLLTRIDMANVCTVALVLSVQVEL
jgi:hypothetical protein